MMRIKRDDRVIVITGKDKGKIGKVLRVLPEQGRVIVENINMIKKSRRRTKQDQQGGIISKEASIHISNVMLVDKKADKPTRFSVSILKDGSRERVSKVSGEVL